MTSQSVQKESPGERVSMKLCPLGKRVHMKISGLGKADMDMSSLPSPSRKSSRVKDTNGSMMTSHSVQKESPGKRVPMKLSGGAHIIQFGDLAKTSGTRAFEYGQRESMIKKSSKKILQEDKDSVEPEKFKIDQAKQAFAKSLQKIHDFCKTAPHLFSEVAPIDTQSPMRSKFHQGAQNSPRSVMDVLAPSTPEQFDGERDSSRRKSSAKQAVPINRAIQQSKQELDNVLQDLSHLTQTVSQTGVSQAVPTRGPCLPDVTPPPSPSPIAPARNDAPCEWEDETFNAFVSTKQAQTFAAPAIKPQTPKTNEFSSTKQIQAAAAPASKPTAPTKNASSASATKPLAANTGAGGWEDFENLFANDFKTAFANAHPKVKVATKKEQQ
jgi:hypothetical protein